MKIFTFERSCVVRSVANIVEHANVVQDAVNSWEKNTNDKTLNGHFEDFKTNKDLASISWIRRLYDCSRGVAMLECTTNAIQAR